MPRIQVFFYKEKGLAGSVPVLQWLRTIRRKDRRGFAKCWERIQRLIEFGHELRRPHADLLRDRIHELRVRHGKVQYRLLYFFHGQDVAILAHAIIKRGAKVPAAEIDLAVERRRQFENAPGEHAYEEDQPDDEENARRAEDFGSPNR